MSIPGLVPVYRHHYCKRGHKSYHSFAECVFKRASVSGEGSYVTASCRKKRPGYLAGRYVVHLHETEQDAMDALERINTAGCGGGCQSYFNPDYRHQLARIDLGRESCTGASQGPGKMESNEQRNTSEPPW